MRKIGDYITTSEKGANDGVATLDSSGQVPANQLGNAGGGGGGNTIYSANDTVTSDRTVSLDNNKLTFNVGTLASGTSTTVGLEVDGSDIYYGGGNTSTPLFKVKGDLGDVLNLNSGGYLVTKSDYNSAIANFINRADTQGLKITSGTTTLACDRFEFTPDVASTTTGVFMQASSSFQQINMKKGNVKSHWLRGGDTYAQASFFINGFSGQGFNVGSGSKIGSEDISLRGRTFIKGNGTTTGVTLRLYDNDTTPNKTWEWLDNGSITQYQNCIHTIDGTKNYSINKSSGDTALTIHGNANSKGLLSLTSAGARLIWNAGTNTEILVGNGGASVKNGSWKIINSGGATLFDVGSNSSGKILSSASAWIRVMFNDTVVKVANLFIAFEVNTVEIARFTTTSLLMSKNIDMDNNRIINTVVNPSVQEATNSATFTINADEETDGVLTAMSANTTIAAPTGTPVQCQDLVFRFKDDGTARALTWNAIFRAIGVTLPTTTVANKLTYVGCKYNSTDSKWDVVAVQQEA